MATPKSTRIAIVIIAIMMVVGTIGSFAVIILADENQKIDNDRSNQALAEWQADQAEYQAKLDAQSHQLSERYYDKFSQYADRPAGYNKDDIKELSTSDLQAGDGAVVDDELAFAVYYLGWNSDGKVFDGSIDGESLKSPLSIEDGLIQASLIEGWKEGLKGMKIGGVREISIPSELAYGEVGSGNDIPPNMPIKFVVLAIELPEQIAAPEIPEALMRGAYGGL